jgi:endonuclease/exonuclease/phosphatase (EEP) superfamily protein YafD
VTPVRLLVSVLGGLLLAGGAVGIGAHYSGFVSTTLTLIASFTPLFIVMTAGALILLALARRRSLAVLAAVVLALGVWTQIPLYRAAASTDAAPGAPVIRLMQANIFLGQADTGSVVDTVRERDVDILTVSELTGEAARGLAAAGLHQELPYSFLQPREGGGGTGMYSRFPLSEPQALPGFVLGNLRATVAIPGAAPTVVYALHPLPPWPQPAYRWMAELEKLHQLFDGERRPLIVGADFNSTWDHRQFRRVLDGTEPLRDAAEFTGAGIVATYPADRGFPAVLAIDRILTRGGTPLSFARIDIPGSDHYGVVGDIRLDN